MVLSSLSVLGYHIVPSTGVSSKPNNIPNPIFQIESRQKKEKKTWCDPHQEFIFAFGIRIFSIFFFFSFFKETMSDIDDFVMVDATDAVPACTNFAPTLFNRKKCKHCRMPKECHQQVTNNTSKSSARKKSVRLSLRKSDSSDSCTSSSDSDTESDSSDSDSYSDSSDSDSDTESDSENESDSDTESDWDTESDSELAALIARLTDFYQYFCPAKAKLSYVSTMLESWEGDEEDMFRHLLDEVYPAKEAQIIQEEKTARQDIINFRILEEARFASEAADLIETCVKRERDRVQRYLDHLGIKTMNADNIHANDLRRPDVLWSRLIQTHGVLPHAQDRALGGVNRYFTPTEIPNNSPLQSTQSAYGVTAFRV